MTVGGLLAALIGWYVVVEVMAFAARQPEGIGKPSPLAGHPWKSRWIGFLLTLLVLAIVAVLSGATFGLIYLCEHLNERII